MYKLPVWGTVSTVYAFIWHERMAWFKFALALLTLVLIGFALMMLQVFGISLLSENAEGNGLVIVLLGLIILFFSGLCRIVPDLHRRLASPLSALA